MESPRKSPHRKSVGESKHLGSQWVSSYNVAFTTSDLKLLIAQETQRRTELEERKRHAEGTSETVVKQEALRIQDEIRKLSTKVASLKLQGAKLLKDKIPSKVDRPNIYTAMDAIRKLENASAYLSVSKYVKDLSDMIEANLASELHSEAVDLLQTLIRVQVHYIQSSACTNLKGIINATVDNWNQVLQNKLETDFEKVLEDFGWPSKIDTVPAPTLKCQEKFHQVSRSLMRMSSMLQEQNKQQLGSMDSAVLMESQGTVLPVAIMMAPLKKRFYFHFFTNKVTNDPKRPEWYFTQVKTWFRQLTPFVRKTRLEELSVSELGVSSVYDFAVQLSAMLKLKVHAQLNDTNDIEDTVFAKILEESITLENEMAATLNEFLPEDSYTVPPIVSGLFSQKPVLQKWLNIEKKVCWEKLDELFASSTAWDRAVFPGPTEVADLFLALLRFVTDRFAYLREASDRLEFLELLLELIDDFRVRCLQTWTSRQQLAVHNADDVLIDYHIADTLHTVRTTLESWEDLPFFASLSAHLAEKEEQDDMESGSEDIDDTKEDLPANNRNQLISHPSQGVFHNALHLYTCLLDTMLSSWCDHLINDLKKSIQRNYSNRKWHMLPPNAFQEGGETLSEGILTTVQNLKAACTGVSTSMNSSLGKMWLKRLAIRFDEMITREVIHRHRFTPGAIAQVKFDIVYGIFPIFSDRDVNTSLFLVGINSALRVWEMPSGKALLLKETLKDSSLTFEEREDTLAELEISLNPSEVIRLLESRIDLDI